MMPVDPFNARRVREWLTADRIVSVACCIAVIVVIAQGLWR